MNKFLIIFLSLSILLAGILIVKGVPLDNKALGWVWIVWGITSTFNVVVVAKNIKWWNFK